MASCNILVRGKSHCPLFPLFVSLTQLNGLQGSNILLNMRRIGLPDHVSFASLPTLQFRHCDAPGTILSSTVESRLLSEATDSTAVGSVAVKDTDVTLTSQVEEYALATIQSSSLRYHDVCDHSGPSPIYHDV